MKESFIFYNSFFEAINELDNNTQLEVYQAITKYALNDELPNLNGVAKAIFSLIKPQIDANNKRYEDGCKGGRPKNKKPVVLKNDENKKPVVLKKCHFLKPNENENVNVNVNVSYPPISPQGEKEEERVLSFNKKFSMTKSEFKEELQKQLVDIKAKSSSNDPLMTQLEEKVVKVDPCSNPIAEEGCANFEPNRVRRSDPFTDPLIDRCFKLYRDNCANLCKLSFEPRNRQTREDLTEFLDEIDRDVGYFEELCKKANKLRKICDKTIDFKMLIRNYIGIMNGKYENSNGINIEELDFS